MAAIQFPANPNVGDLFTASNGIRYTYDGEKWKTLGTSTVGSEGQFLETPTVLTVDKLIPANTNTGVVGPIAIGTGVVLTVPSSSTFRTLTGRSGAGSGGNTEIEPKMPISGGTFTGPVNFANDAIIKGNAVDGSGKLTLNCENNSHGIHIKGPPHSAGANYTLTLPNDTGTNGQVLTTNGSGVSSWSTIDLSSKLSLTGGTLTGDLTIPDKIIHSGDTDTSIRFPSANTFAIETAGTQRVTVDSSGNVGIGTTSPVNSTNYVNLALSDISGGLVTFMQGATQSADIIGGSGLYLRTLDASPITFRTNGSNERMRIDSSGRLLVGTTTEGEATADDLTIATSGHTGITIRSSTFDNSNIYFSDGTSGADEYRGIIRYAHSLDSLDFWSNAQHRMRIDSSGNVGINSTAPRTKLSVLNGSSGYPSGSGLGSGAIACLESNGNVGLQFLSNSSYSNYIYFGDESSASTGSIQYSHGANALIFKVNGGSERARIDSSGRLLVGTSSVIGAGNDLLVLKGTAATDASFYLGRNANASTISNGNGLGYIKFGGGDGGEAARIAGIADGTWSSTSDCPGRLVFSTSADGSSSPSERLIIDSSGTATFSGFVDCTRNAGDSFGYLGIGPGGTNEKAIFVNRSGEIDLELYSNYSGSATVSINSNGSATFAGNTQVGGASYGNVNGLLIEPAGGIRATNDTTSYHLFRGYTRGNPSNTSSITADGSATFAGSVKSTNGSGSAFLGATSGTGVAINNSSNVTVIELNYDGSATFGSYGTGNGEILLASSTSGNCNIFMGDGATGVDYYRGYIQYKNSADAMCFATSNTERLRIDSSGRVGIGTSPVQALHVAVASNDIARFESTTLNGSATIEIKPQSSSGKARIDVVDNAADFSISTVGKADALLISNAGNVGIGTTNPSATLHVVGTGQYTGAQRGSVGSHTLNGTISLNLNERNNYKFTLSGNGVLSNPSNQTAGQHGVIELVQDGTGGRTASFGSNWKFPGGTAPTLSTAANAQDLLAYYVAASGTIYAQLIVDLK